MHNPPERFEEHWTKDTGRKVPWGFVTILILLVSIIAWLGVLTWALVKYL